MDGEQQNPSSETKTPSPAHLCSPAPPADERRPDSQLGNFPDSSSPQRISNLMSWSAHDLKVAADQGDAVAQFNYGVCLKKGEGVQIDFKGAAHYFKLAADQGFAAAQLNYGNCLKNGEGVSIDFEGAAHYFKHAADQGFAAAQLNYVNCPITLLRPFHIHHLLIVCRTFSVASSKIQNRWMMMAVGCSIPLSD
jgi:TPR repeat protein